MGASLTGSTGNRTAIDRYTSAAHTLRASATRAGADCQSMAGRATRAAVIRSPERRRRRDHLLRPAIPVETQINATPARVMSCARPRISSETTIAVNPATAAARRWSTQSDQPQFATSAAMPLQNAAFKPIRINASAIRQVRGDHDLLRRCIRIAARHDFPAASEERSEEHTSELQSLAYLVCRLML